MIQGQNVTLEVYTITEGADDYAGGAQPTGTLAGTVYARIDKVPGQDLLLGQGIEAPQIWQAEITNIGSVWVVINENDQVKLVQPIDHQLYNHRLRVRSVSESSMLRSDTRHFRSALLSRVVTSHRNLP